MRMLFTFFTFALGLGSFPCVMAVASEPMHDAQVEAFEFKGIHWTVNPRSREKASSELPADLEVRSESGELGYAEPAWAGDDPGELGLLWAIYNADGIVIGTCSSSPDHPTIRCINIFLHEAFPASTLEPPFVSPVQSANVDRKNSELIRFRRNSFAIELSRLPSSRMPNSWMFNSQLPSSQFPVSRMPDSWMPDSRLPSSQFPESRMSDSWMPDSSLPDTHMPSSRMSSSPLSMWP